MEAVGWLDASLHNVMDFDLWLRLLLRFSAIYDPRVKANFRIHPASKTQAKTRVGDEHWQLVNTFFNSAALSSEVRAMEPMARSHAWLMRGAQYYADGRTRDARRFLWLALSGYPRVLRCSIFWTVLVRSFVPSPWMSTFRNLKREAKRHV